MQRKSARKPQNKRDLNCQKPPSGPRTEHRAISKSIARRCPRGAQNLQAGPSRRTRAAAQDGRRRRRIKPSTHLISGTTTLRAALRRWLASMPARWWLVLVAATVAAAAAAPLARAPEVSAAVRLGVRGLGWQTARPGRCGGILGREVGLWPCRKKFGQEVQESTRQPAQITSEM